jgi:hypothetical protein
MESGLACDSKAGATGNEVDYVIFFDYNSTPHLITIPYPDPRMDAIAEAQRRELDFDKRSGLLKDFQHLAAELMQTIPGQHIYPTFSFRWPWLHNTNHGELGSPPPGREAWGSHLHWLDVNMPNRDRRV